MSLFTYIYWDVSPYIIELDYFKLRWYSLAWSISVVLGYLICKQVYKKMQLPTSQAVILVQYVFLSNLIGARLGEVFFYNWDYFVAHPLHVFKVWEGGLASHGAVIGVLVAVFLYARSRPYTSYLQTLDVLTIGAALCGGIIRIGNLFNAEIVGKTTMMPWAFIFPQLDLVARHPLQLYEALLAFALFGLLMAVLYRYHPRLKTGTLTALFFIIGFSGRFILEHWKNEPYPSQLLNIPIVLLGFLLLYHLYKPMKT